MKTPASIRLLLLASGLLIVSFGCVTALAGSIDGELAQRALCDERTRCFIAELSDAGTTAGGLQLDVAVLVLGNPDSDWKNPNSVDCTPFQLWLIRSRNSEIESTQLMVSLCNNGYGARMLGEDRFEVRENQMSHTQIGGSAWMWSQTHVLRLHPLTLLSQEIGGYWTLGPNEERQFWDWTTYDGSVSWVSPRCDSEDTPPEMLNWLSKDYTYTPIPRFDLEPADIDKFWTTTALGDCAAIVTADEEEGFIIYGTPGESADSLMKVLMVSNRIVIVEVTDDHWVSGSSSWLQDDHLELWLGDLPNYYHHCIDTSQKPEQWGITFDGVIHPAYGEPADEIMVEMTELGKTKRFRIRLPEAVKGITVVYSDSDDGKQQERLTATSDLKFGDLPTLGATFRIDPNRSSCHIKQDSLVIVPKKHTQSDKAFLTLH